MKSTATNHRVFGLLLSLSFILLPSHAFASVLITEVIYDLPGSDAGREWVEITNTGSDPVDVSKYRLFENGTNHVLTLSAGSATLAAGEVAIIADNYSKFLADWPQYSGTLFDSSFSLSNTGETLEIKDDTLATLDSVTYSSDGGAAGDGNTLHRSGDTLVPGAPDPGVYTGSAPAAVVAPDPTPTPDPSPAPDPAPAADQTSTSTPTDSSSSATSTPDTSTSTSTSTSTVSTSPSDTAVADTTAAPQTPTSAQTQTQTQTQPPPQTLATASTHPIAKTDTPAKTVVQAPLTTHAQTVIAPQKNPVSAAAKKSSSTKSSVSSSNVSQTAAAVTSDAPFQMPTLPQSNNLWTTVLGLGALIVTGVGGALYVRSPKVPLAAGETTPAAEEFEIQ